MAVCMGVSTIVSNIDNFKSKSVNETILFQTGGKMKWPEKLQKQDCVSAEIMIITVCVNTVISHVTDHVIDLWRFCGSAHSSLYVWAQQWHWRNVHDCSAEMKVDTHTDPEVCVFVSLPPQKSVAERKSLSGNNWQQLLCCFICKFCINEFHLSSILSSLHTTRFTRVLKAPANGSGGLGDPDACR